MQNWVINSVRRNRLSDRRLGLRFCIQSHTLSSTTYRTHLVYDLFKFARQSENTTSSRYLIFSGRQSWFRSLSWLCNFQATNFVTGRSLVLIDELSRSWYSSVSLIFGTDHCQFILIPANSYLLNAITYTAIRAGHESITRWWAHKRALARGGEFQVLLISIW